MGISIRQSIAWLPGPHTEPTSTVVLTSPEPGYHGTAHRFVDLRILKDAQGTASSTVPIPPSCHRN